MHGGHRLHRMRAANGLCVDLAKTKAPDFAFLDQVLDGARDVLDRHSGVEPVLIEQLDGLDPQALERFFRDTPDVLGGTVQLALEVLAIDDAVPELGRYVHLAPERVQPFTGQFLVDKRPIDLGGVEQCHAALGRLMQQLDHGFAVGMDAAVVVHAHDAEAQGGDLHVEVARTKGSLLGDIGEVHGIAPR